MFLVCPGGFGCANIVLREAGERRSPCTLPAIPSRAKRYGQSLNKQGIFRLIFLDIENKLHRNLGKHHHMPIYTHERGGPSPAVSCRQSHSRSSFHHKINSRGTWNLRKEEGESLIAQGVISIAESNGDVRSPRTRQIYAVS